MKFFAFAAPTLATLFLIACSGGQPGTDSATTSTPPSLSEFKLIEIWSTEPVLKTPESVIHDAERDVLFVANINENPSEKDGNGFISKLARDGTVLDLEWVSGLHAPKGMGIANNTLYVTDIDEIVAIDIQKGVITERIPVSGAAFLNDIAIDETGTVYVTDSATGKLHTLRNAEVGLLIPGELKRPNGLYWDGDRLLLGTSESSELMSIDPETGNSVVLNTGMGRVDGIEFTGHDGLYLVSDWSGEIFLVSEHEKASLLNTKDSEINSADIGYIMDDQTVLVPTFFDNRVVAYRLER